MRSHHVEYTTGLPLLFHLLESPNVVKLDNRESARSRIRPARYRRIFASYPPGEVILIFFKFMLVLLICLRRCYRVSVDFVLPSGVPRLLQWEGFCLACCLLYKRILHSFTLGCLRSVLNGRGWPPPCVRHWCQLKFGRTKKITCHRLMLSMNSVCTQTSNLSFIIFVRRYRITINVRRELWFCLVCAILAAASGQCVPNTAAIVAGVFNTLITIARSSTTALD